jgi:hypothetical protein
LIPQWNLVACHAEGRGFEPRRSRHDFVSEIQFTRRVYRTRPSERERCNWLGTS